MVRPKTVDRTMVRVVVVHVRVRSDQARKWKAKADRLGITVSKWLRALADRDARM